jgi:hypothetical protein
MREATISAAQAAMPSIDEHVSLAGGHQHHPHHHRDCRSHPQRRQRGSTARRHRGGAPVRDLQHEP